MRGAGTFVSGDADGGGEDDGGGGDHHKKNKLSDLSSNLRGMHNCTP